MSVAAMLLLLQAGAGLGTPRFCLTVDSGRREVTVRAGPFRIPGRAATGGHDHRGRRQQEDEIHVAQFEWPATIAIGGFRLRLVDSGGKPLPRDWIHHLYFADFDRRELVYPLVQRVIGMGRETPDLSLPHGIGITIPAGHTLGFYVNWHNESHVPREGVHIELGFRMVTRTSEQITVFPFFVHANVALGADWTFPIPPGGGSASYEFRLPISGRLLLAGGHLHAHGISVRLEEAETKKEIVTLRARRDSAGQILEIPLRALAVAGEGPHLRAGRRYRLVARYDNPGDQPIPAAMGELVGLFRPDDPRQWPAIDAKDPSFVQDRDLLTSRHPAGKSPVSRPGRIVVGGRCGGP